MDTCSIIIFILIIQVNSSTKGCTNIKAGMSVDLIHLFYKTGKNCKTTTVNVADMNKNDFFAYIGNLCNGLRGCILDGNTVRNKTCDGSCGCPEYYDIVYSCSEPVSRQTTTVRKLVTSSMYSSTKDKSSHLFLETTTTDLPSSSIGVKSKGNSDSKVVPVEENITSLICAVLACIVFGIIIIIFIVICIRRRRDRQQRAHYHQDDEYASIAATPKKKNVHQDKFLPSTSAAVTKPPTSDGDNNPKDEINTFPLNDEQYAVLSSTSKAYVRMTSTGHSKTVETKVPKQSANEGWGKEQTSGSSDETEQKEEVSALYSTVNKLKKKSMTTVDPAPDQASDSNDVYSHLFHITQQKTETENVYNG